MAICVFKLFLVFKLYTRSPNPDCINSRQLMVPNYLVGAFVAIFECLYIIELSARVKVVENVSLDKQHQQPQPFSTRFSYLNQLTLLCMRESVEQKKKMGRPNFNFKGVPN